MNRTFRSPFLRLAGLTALLLCTPVLVQAQAQPWPNRPIRMVAPFSPGGAVDVLARPLAQKLSEVLGQPVVVENRPGSNGTIGFNNIAKSQPDGYSLLAGTMNNYVINLFTKDVPYDPTLDFVFIGEELMHAARLYTAGYDVYTPRKNVLTHFYGRQDKPKFWTDLASMKSRQEESNVKVRRLLGFEQPPIENYEYGFGTKRTLKSYYEFAHIDPVAKTTDSAVEFCSWPI